VNLIFQQVSASGASNGTAYPVQRGEEGRGKRILYEVSGTCSFFIQTRANAAAAWLDVSASLTATGSQIIVLGPETRVRVASSTTATIRVWVEDAKVSTITNP